MEQELWKDLEKFKDYQVSNLGRIRSLKNGKCKIRKITQDNHGYAQVTFGLGKSGKIITQKVYKLVAQAFIPNPLNLPCVNHKDENTLNSRADNLEWCTYKYNINYGNRNKKASKSLSKPIYQYDLEGNFIREWKSATQAGKELGIGQANINACLLGKYKKSHGYIWKYKLK